ncbi:hypothetical protein NE237_024776 [Protea cynaroides]|uniref:Late embryogenesis abundant protein LEA-2 subgroup domain-containing protein n=1 Tax=Protea cynaroides TaxID=273540 RepID=A0A9Q0K0Q9_9MAGN|nr:hypothetical protein NE237_024776 [Protea cynaroides]
MAAKGEPVYYSPLPPEPSVYDHRNSPNYHQPPPPPPPPQGQCYVLLPLYHRRLSRFRSLRSQFICGASLVLLGVAIFFLWPSDPEIIVVGLGLNHVKVHTIPTVSLDISMPITVKVRNRDFFSLNYRSLVVAIEYRGKQLGYVTSQGGHLRARGSSYIDATLQLQEVEVYDVFQLLKDLTRGRIPFETVTQVQGQLGLFFFNFPLQTKVSCEVIVDTDNQTIVHRNCYP